MMPGVPRYIQTLLPPLYHPPAHTYTHREREGTFYSSTLARHVEREKGRGGMEGGAVGSLYYGDVQSVGPTRRTDPG